MRGSDDPFCPIRVDIIHKFLMRTRPRVDTPRISMFYEGGINTASIKSRSVSRPTCLKHLAYRSQVQIFPRMKTIDINISEIIQANGLSTRVHFCIRDYAYNTSVIAFESTIKKSCDSCDRIGNKFFNWADCDWGMRIFQPFRVCDVRFWCWWSIPGAFLHPSQHK